MSKAINVESYTKLYVVLFPYDRRQIHENYVSIVVCTHMSMSNTAAPPGMPWIIKMCLCDISLLWNSLQYYILSFSPSVLQSFICLLDPWEFVRYVNLFPRRTHDSISHTTSFNGCASNPFPDITHWVGAQCTLYACLLPACRRMQPPQHRHQRQVYPLVRVCKWTHFTYSHDRLLDC